MLFSMTFHDIVFHDLIKFHIFQAFYMHGLSFTMHLGNLDSHIQTPTQIVRTLTSIKMHIFDLLK